MQLHCIDPVHSGLVSPINMIAPSRLLEGHRLTYQLSQEGVASSEDLERIRYACEQKCSSERPRHRSRIGEVIVALVEKGGKVLGRHAVRLNVVHGLDIETLFHFCIWRCPGVEKDDKRDEQQWKLKTSHDVRKIVKESKQKIKESWLFKITKCHIVSSMKRTLWCCLNWCLVVADVRGRASHNTGVRDPCKERRRRQQQPLQLRFRLKRATPIDTLPPLNIILKMVFFFGLGSLFYGTLALQAHSTPS
jgi:hypothetical protein